LGQLGIDGRMAASNEDAPDIDGSNGAAIDIDGGAVPFGLAARWAPRITMRHLAVILASDTVGYSRLMRLSCE
jgi:hypothetical protein